MRYGFVLLAALLAACGSDGGGGGSGGAGHFVPEGRPLLEGGSIVVHEEDPGTVDSVEGLPGAALGAEKIEVLTDAGFGDVVDVAVVEADGSFRPLALGDNALAEIWLVAENEDGRSDPFKVQNDIEKPIVTMHGGPDEWTTETSAEFQIGCTEEGCTYLCALDRGDFEPCTPPIRLDDLPVGAHQFLAKATDPAGNTSDAKSHGWNIEAN